MVDSEDVYTTTLSFLAVYLHEGNVCLRRCFHFVASSVNITLSIFSPGGYPMGALQSLEGVDV